MENLSKKFADQFPFLEFYSEFRLEFNKIKEKQSEYKYLEVELIKRIANSLKTSLYSLDASFLKYYVTRIYSRSILYHILKFIVKDISANENNLKSIIREYQLINLKSLITYLEKEKKIVQNHYDSLLTNTIANEILTRTKIFIDNFWQINQ